MFTTQNRVLQMLNFAEKAPTKAVIYRTACCLLGVYPPTTHTTTS